MIKKQLISAALIASMVFSLSAPVMADNNSKSNKPAIKYVAKKTKFERAVAKKEAITKKLADKKGEQSTKKLYTELKKLEQQLSVLKMQLAKAESKLKETAEVSKPAEIKKAESYEAKVLKLEQKWKNIMDKAAAQDKQEIARLDKEISDWTAHVDRIKANTADYISKLNEKLKKDIAEIDAKIAAAKTDAEKQALVSAKEAKQKYTALRIEAIEKYMSELNTFWTEKQKSFELRKELLLKKQAMDMEYKTKLMEIEKAELAEKKPVETQTAVTPATTTNTTTVETTTTPAIIADPVIEVTPAEQPAAVEVVAASTAVTIEKEDDKDEAKEAAEKLEKIKRIDELKQKIQAVEKAIADLKAKLQ